MITEQSTVAEIAGGSLAAIRVFMNHGIAFCCTGQKQLAAVCESKGLSPGDLISELSAAMADPTPEDVDWTRASTKDLIRRILDRHHAYTRAELPRLAAWLDRVMSKHGQRDAAILSELPYLFGELRQELDSHMLKEEAVLFPNVLRFTEAAESNRPLPSLPFGSFEAPLRVMEADHALATSLVEQIRERTLNFTPPPQACPTYRALFAGLQELSADLQVHLHLENNILFPRTRAMFAALTPSRF